MTEHEWCSEPSHEGCGITKPYQDTESVLPRRTMILYVNHIGTDPSTLTDAVIRDVAAAVQKVLDHQPVLRFTLHWEIEDK